MRQNLKALSKRSADAWTRKDQWKPMLQDAYKLAVPNHETFDEVTPGGSKVDRIFDSTLIQSTVAFANRYATELFTPMSDWQAFVPGRRIRRQLEEAQLDELSETLEYISEEFFSALQVSNFDSAIHEFLQDFAVGTAALLILEGDDDMPVRFICVPPSEFALEVGPWGSVSAVYRKHKTHARNLKGEWPDLFEHKSAPKPEQWDNWLSRNKDKEICVYEATYCTPGERASKRMWSYDVYLEESGLGSTDGPLRIVARDYSENPWVVARYSRVSGEVYGRGCVLNVLPDAKVLNRTKEFLLRNAALAISGMWTAVDDGVLNPDAVVFRPGAVIQVARNEGAAQGPSLAALPMPGNFDVAQLTIEEHRDSIKNGMGDNALPPDQRSPKSAAEIFQRFRKDRQQNGAPIGRMHSELLRPLSQRVVNILINRGFIQVPGLTKFKVDGGNIDIELKSSMAQSYELNELEGFVTWTEICISILGPQLFAVVANVDHMPKYTAEKLSLPVSELIRKPGEQKELMQAFLNMQQQAAQVQESASA